MRQRIGNYPGVTVERHIGTLKTDKQTVELVDLPGTHGLSAHSLEEHITVDVVLGRIAGTQPPDGILAVVDATNLYQGLYLVQQLLELDLPVLIALTMSDAAEASGLKFDIEALSARLSGVRICPVVATTGKGINDLRNALVELPGQPAPAPSESWPELSSAARELAETATVPLRPAEIERLLIDGPIGANKHVLDCLGENAEAEVERFREQLFGSEPPLAREARIRYAWVREVLTEVQNQVPVFYSWRSRLKSWINQPIPGTIGLFLVMAIVFQAVFAWATPVMDLIDNVTAVLGSVARGQLGAGPLSSLVSEFIILLEDSGYLARAAYLMDRAMRSAGLSGQSIIPMISSFACAVPGIMATRVIPNRRDRIATIIAAPFMTCSARLPVYALLIAAFVPAKDIGLLNLQGLVLFGLYMFGIVAGVLTALLLRKTALRGPKPPFALMLPEFRRPNIQTVLMQLYTRAKIFLYRAGTVIFAVAVVVWALSYYPRATDIDPGLTANQAAAVQLEQSWLGRAGKFVEPVFEPLGWDWRVSSAVIAGFPAREVVVAVMGTIYAVGDEADESTLSARLKSATWPDGRLVFTLPMVLGLLIFYACCLQCAATLAVIRRETGGWRWPAFAWIYMTSIGYLGALLVYQLGS
jgi:ferrous iron transport protein B